MPVTLCCVVINLLDQEHEDAEQTEARAVHTYIHAYILAYIHTFMHVMFVLCCIYIDTCIPRYIDT